MARITTRNGPAKHYFADASLSVEANRHFLLALAFRLAIHRHCEADVGSNWMRHVLPGVGAKIVCEAPQVLNLHEVLRWSLQPELQTDELRGCNCVHGRDVELVKACVEICVVADFQGVSDELPETSGWNSSKVGSLSQIVHHDSESTPETGAGTDRSHLVKGYAGRRPLRTPYPSQNPVPGIPAGSLPSEDRSMCSNRTRPTVSTRQHTPHVSLDTLLPAETEPAYLHAKTHGGRGSDHARWLASRTTPLARHRVRGGSFPPQSSKIRRFVSGGRPARFPPAIKHGVSYR